jgi:hypothetical protein
VTFTTINYVMSLAAGLWKKGKVKGSFFDSHHLQSTYVISKHNSHWTLKAPCRLEQEIWRMKAYSTPAAMLPLTVFTVTTNGMAYVHTMHGTNDASTSSPTSSTSTTGWFCAKEGFMIYRVLVDGSCSIYHKSNAISLSMLHLPLGTAAIQPMNQRDTTTVRLNVCDLHRDPLPAGPLAAFSNASR